MIKLAVLLMGAAAMHRRWGLLTVLGAAWTVLGLLIMADASDGVTVVATESFGYLLIVEGLIAVVVTVASAITGGRLVLARSICLIGLGLVIIDMPWRNDIANSLLFGLAFLIDGTVRIAAALMLRHPRWRITAFGGVIELVLAILALTNWPLSYEKTVPFCIGVVLLMSGVAILRFGLTLRRLPPQASVTELPLFRQRGWHSALPPGDALAWRFEPRKEHPLTVHVWTPTGSARDAARRPLLDRYVAAVDRKGVISTGHASLTLAPDLYISHYPAAEADRSRGDFVRALRATAENDLRGRFLTSYAAETAEWFDADAHVRFRRCNVGRLEKFWAAYRRDDTYNLTNRNCSVVVALALDAALEGAVGRRRGWFGFLWLLFNPDLWLAAALRARAEALTWTPGLILDYARALRRVVEPRPVPWLARFTHIVKTYRARRAGSAETNFA